MTIVAAHFAQMRGNTISEKTETESVIGNREEVRKSVFRWENKKHPKFDLWTVYLKTLQAKTFH